METNNYTVFGPVSYNATTDLTVTTIPVFDLLSTEHNYDVYVRGNESYEEPNNNEDWMEECNIVYNSEISQNLFEFWICGIVLNIVVILGIVGNAVSIYVLTRPQMRSSSINYLLINLAICDTILIVTSMLLFGIPSIYPYTGYLFFYYNYIYPFISPLAFPLAMIAQTSSIYMTFIITVERYVAVCHPLKARALCTYGRAKLYFFICITFSIIYNVPRFFEVLVISTVMPESLVKLYCIRPTNLRRNLTYINIYIHWCYLIVNYIIPLSFLATFNCLIYRKVKLTNRERQHLSRSEIREIGFATMLISVVVVFLALNTLALVVNVSEVFYNFIDPALTKISNLMVTINSSCNFIIYMLFGEKFRRTFCQTFCKRWLKSNTSSNIIYDSSISNNDSNIVIYKSSRHFTRQNTGCSVTSTTSSVSPRMNSSIKSNHQVSSAEAPVVYYPPRFWQNNNNNNNCKNVSDANDNCWFDTDNPT